MPSSKKPNKKEDQKQKSLFSFVEDKEKEQKAPKKSSKKQPLKEEKQIDQKKTVIEEPKTKEIPKELFFKTNNEPIGLQVDDVKLEKVLRESMTSKYIRYLIEKGEIVKNLERGLLLDVDY
ncbi:MAG: hypothetical protein ACFFGP_07025, partial [Promethearchaeota archaeon]